MGSLYVPSFQTNALMVQPAGGNNFGIVPPSCIVGLASMFQQRCVFFSTKKYCFLVLLEMHVMKLTIVDNSSWDREIIPLGLCVDEFILLDLTNPDRLSYLS